MRWIAKHPPIYVWPGDTWYNETNKQVYGADTLRLLWRPRQEGLEDIQFAKKTRVFPYDKS